MPEGPTATFNNGFIELAALLFKSLNQRMGFLCAAVLAVTLTAGLWPFHTPTNDAQWLGDGNGLFFGKHGSIVSTGPFAKITETHEQACSLEIYWKPLRLDEAGTMLAFYSPESRKTGFSIRQSLTDIKLETPSPNVSRQISKLYLDALHNTDPVLLTIASTKNGSTIYVNGKTASRSAEIRLRPADLNGLLVLADAPNTPDSWSGTLLGLSVYDRELAGPEVATHLSDWKNSLSPADGSVASYSFHASDGRVIHSLASGGPDLVIPDRFFVLNPQFLQRPWDEFHQTLNYAEDTAINIFGFIPLGFCFAALFARTRTPRRALLLTAALGFTVSLWIEVLQSFLPTRNSGMTDLITNTAGSALGAWLALWCLRQFWLRQRVLSPQ